MFRKFVSILIFSIFFVGVTNEVSDSFHSFSTEYTFNKISLITPTIYVSDCKSCPDEKCHGQDAHCFFHCFGIHNLTLINQVLELYPANIAKNKMSWYFNFHYDEPFLDSSLRPPLFS